MFQGWCDGSYDIKRNIGAIGYVVKRNGELVRSYRRVVAIEEDQHQVEFIAIVFLFQWLVDHIPDGEPVTIYTDDSGVIQAITDRTSRHYIKQLHEILVCLDQLRVRQNVVNIHQISHAGNLADGQAHTALQRARKRRRSTTVIDYQVIPVRADSEKVVPPK